MSLFLELYQKRTMVWDLAKADFKKRFVGSYFGVAWMFVQPIVTVLIYFFVFQMGFRSVPPVPDTPYLLWLIPGIVPWFYFSEVLNLGTNCLQEYNYLVKKVVFRVEILPLIKLLSCFFVHTIFLVILLCVFLAYARLPMITWLQIGYYSLAASLYSLGIVYITASVHVFFKDMGQIVSIALQFGMWLTPIMWAPEMFAARPGWLEPLLKINPFYYIVTGYRDSLLGGNFFWERPMLGIYFWCITLVLLVLGLRVFKSLRPHFSDVL